MGEFDEATEASGWSGSGYMRWIRWYEASVGLRVRAEELVGSIGFRLRVGVFEVKSEHYIKQLYTYHYYLWDKCQKEIYMLCNLCFLC